MRSTDRSVRRALTIGALAATALAWSGCTAAKQTEYVAGVSTQVTVPRDLQAIVISITVSGISQFCQAYKVYDGKVQLPRSLGELPFSGKPGEFPITVTVAGLTEPLTDASPNPIYTDCTNNPGTVGSNNVRILRRSRQPYVLDEILFLPMPLKFSCFDTNCGDDTGTTCKAGLCGTSTTDETKLPRYAPELVDGTGGACFPAGQCFAAAVPVVVVDPDSCTYAIPNTASAPPLLPGVPPNPVMSVGDGVNVEIAYDGGFTTEVLDKDPDEGFIIDDPTKPQRFRLAPGLCNMVHGTNTSVTPPVDTPHRVTLIRASATCQAKSRFQPICADDQNNLMSTPGGIATNPTPPTCTVIPLKPSKSVLMLLADNTDNNNIFYTGGSGPGGSGSGAIINQSTLVGAALADPAFKNTRIGLTLYPDQLNLAAAPNGACTGHTPVVEPALAATSRGAIAAEFTTLGANGGSSLRLAETELDLTGALQDAYARLRLADAADANRRAVLVIGNKGFADASCGSTPVTVAGAALSTDKINTYVAVLGRDKDDPTMATSTLGEGDLATAGAVAPPPPAPKPRPYDVRRNPNDAQELVRKIAGELGTCAYDVTTKPSDDSVLVYSDPTAAGPAPLFYKIAHDATCNDNGVATANGWGSKTINPTTTRIFVCGTLCDDLRGRLTTAAAYAAQYGQPSAEVPLFAYTSTCAPQ